MVKVKTKFVRVIVEKLIIGPQLTESLKKLYSELPSNVSRDTLAEVSASIIKRLTRFWWLGLAIAIIPIIQTVILFNQNKLFQEQNKLSSQQLLIDSLQLELFIQQNSIADKQNKLFEQQNSKISSQVDLNVEQIKQIDKQNELLSNQNDLYNKQNQLSESNRRSSLVFLLNNVVDKIDEELKDDYKKNNIRDLSPELIGRIASLSSAFRPYQYLEQGELTKGEYSPERSQMLLTLVYSDLDSNSYNDIFIKSDFDYCYLPNTDFSRFSSLPNSTIVDFMYKGFFDVHYYFDSTFVDSIGIAKFKNLKSRNSDFSGASFYRTDLSFSDFSYSKLQNAIFTQATLKGVSFEGAALDSAILVGANFRSTQFKNTNLVNANMSNSLIETAFFNCDLTNVNLNCALVRDSTFLDNLARLNNKGTRKLLEKYSVEDLGYENYYLIRDINKLKELQKAVRAGKIKLNEAAWYLCK